MNDYNGYEEYHCWVCNKCGQIHYSEEIMKKHILLHNLLEKRGEGK